MKVANDAWAADFSILALMIFLFKILSQNSASNFCFFVKNFLCKSLLCVSKSCLCVTDSLCKSFSV